MSHDKTFKTADASNSGTGSSANQKCEEAKAFQRIRLTSDGDAYVHLGSWAARKSSDSCGKPSQNAPNKVNTANQKSESNPAEEPASTRKSSGDDKFVIIN